MRYWIDLIENVSDDTFFQNVKSMTAHDAPAAQAGYGYTVDGNAYLITNDHIAEMEHRIKNMLDKNPTIYRYILLPPDDLDKYLCGPLGGYWCYDWDIVLDALTGWDSASADAELYRLTAHIKPFDIDMERTIVQNLCGSMGT